MLSGDECICKKCYQAFLVPLGMSQEKPSVWCMESSSCRRQWPELSNNGTFQSECVMCLRRCGPNADASRTMPSPHDGFSIGLDTHRRWCECSDERVAFVFTANVRSGSRCDRRDLLIAVWLIFASSLLWFLVLLLYAI